MSAPGAPVFGSVPHQHPVCISGETNAVVTDFLWNYQQSSYHATAEVLFRGPETHVVCAARIELAAVRIFVQFEV